MSSGTAIKEYLGWDEVTTQLKDQELDPRKTRYLSLMASEQNPQFAAEVPAFVGKIRRIFTAAEIRDYLNHLERTRFPAPPDPDLDIDDLDDEIQDEPWHENPVIGAEELLRFSRAQHLLLP